MKEELTTRARKAMYEFERDTGKRPKFLYLGNDEFDEFEDLAQKQIGFLSSAITSPSLFGMRVISVREVFHFGVGL